MKNKNYYKSNQIPILNILEKMNEEIKLVGSTYRWKKHDSISITDNMWYQHSQNRGGLSIDFLMTFYNLSKDEAIKYLNENFDINESDGTTFNGTLNLPEKHYSNTNIITYLKNFRFIDEDIIKLFIESDLIYQSQEFKDIVFLGKNKNGEIKHAHIHGTLDLKKHIKYNAYGSNAKYSFNFIGSNEKLFVFESPIDMLSYMSLNNSDYTKYSYLALCGLSDKAIFQTLKDFPHLNEVILALDNDIAGFKTTQIILEKLESKGYKALYQFSWLKDYNEDLKYKYHQIAKAGLSNKLFKHIVEFELKIISKTMNHKDVLFKDLLNSFMKLYAIYNNNNQNQINEALLNLASYSTLFLRQQYRHLGKHYAPKEIIKSLQNKPLEYVKYSSVDEKLSEFTKRLEVLKDNFVRKDYHSIDEKKEVMNALSEIIKYSLFLYIKLNERNEKQ